MRPLIILGPVLSLAGVYLVVSRVEMVVRLRRQIQRVMDIDLLDTKNIHEVKHWIEPGEGEGGIEQGKGISLARIHKCL